MAKKKKTGTVSIPDMTDVESFSTLPEGEYHVKVTGVEQKEGNEYDYLNWEFTVESGAHKGAKVWTNTSFSPKSLWNLKNMLDALEADIPEEAGEIEIDELIDLEMMATVEHEEYKGKPRARVTDYAAVSDDKEDVEVDDGDEKKSEKYTVEQIQDMDEDELKELAEKHELEINWKKAKTGKKKVSAVIAALEEEDLLEEED